MTHSPEEKTIAFLDLLGFSTAVADDLHGAARLSEDWADAIKTAMNDAKIDDGTGDRLSGDGRISLSEAMKITSFEDLLPMSDSIFITTSDTTMFIRQLSHFLVTCFEFRLNAFSGTLHPGGPTRVTTNNYVFAGNNSRIVHQQETWWPVLFRGGIAFGQCSHVELPNITRSKSGMSPSLLGKAVVEAVNLEKRTKGPRILCSPAIRDKIHSDSQEQEYLAPPLNGEKDCLELYWPLALFESTNDISDALNNQLGNWLQGVANLYNHFKTDEKVCTHYKAFIRLIISSALKKYPTGEAPLKMKLKSLCPDLNKPEFFSTSN